MTPAPLSPEPFKPPPVFHFGGPQYARHFGQRTYCDKIVLQPTTLCNLNCSYCYLPGRSKNQLMLASVAEAVATAVADARSPISLIWHGGEPFATPQTHFTALIERFSALHDCGKVRHAVQTNATLFSESWCQWIKQNRIGIGVSVDGPDSLSDDRITYAGKPALRRIEAGIALLRRFHIPFGLIAVVNERNVDRPAELLEFALSTGAHSLAINFEEIEGINRRQPVDDDRVVKFWRDLFVAW